MSVNTALVGRLRLPELASVVDLSRRDAQGVALSRTVHHRLRQRRQGRRMPSLRQG